MVAYGRSERGTSVVEVHGAVHLVGETRPPAACPVELF